MSSGVVARLTGELAGLIERLIETQVALREIVREKLAAMRRADGDGILRAATREGRMASTVSQMDRQRHDLVARMCHELGLDQTIDAKDVTLRLLTAKLEPAVGGKLTSLADRLREEMLRLAEANRVVQMVCREMLGHFKTVFAAMMSSGEETATYGRGGQHGPAAARVLDAMG